MKQQIRFQGKLQVPGDKSVSHRALIFSVLAEGTCKVHRLSPAADCQSTIACLRQLGMDVVERSGIYHITSTGLGGLTQPETFLDAGNSGTTIRLLSGLLAGQNMKATLDGDGSLRKRPMARVLKQLTEMGCQVHYEAKENYPPFTITGGNLRSHHFQLQIASAQVQTALLLAGLQADGETCIELPAPVRDHTERMFKYIGVPFEAPTPLKTSVSKLKTPVKPFDLTVPGDISSAAFFMVAAACAPGSEVILTDVGLNPGRTLVIDVLTEMGADLTVTDLKEQAGEPVGTITVRGKNRLKGTTIGGDRIAAGIDEIPAIALAGALCEGTLSVRDAAELRVKESDRLSAIAQNLTAAGVRVEELADGLDIEGTEKLAGGSDWVTFGDHRLAMTGLLGNLLSESPIAVDDTACAAVSYPHFEQDLASLTKR